MYSVHSYYHHNCRHLWYACFSRIFVVMNIQRGILLLKYSGCMRAALPRATQSTVSTINVAVLWRVLLIGWFVCYVIWTFWELETSLEAFLVQTLKLRKDELSTAVRASCAVYSVQVKLVLCCGPVQLYYSFFMLLLILLCNTFAES